MIDFMDFEYFAAKAIAMMQPMECATMCKESNRNGQITDFSIISK